MTRHEAAFWGLVVIGSWLVPSLAIAQTDPSQAPALPSTERLQYSAPPACPAESAFVAAVQKRGQSFGAGGAGGNRSRFEVVIEPETAGFHASLTVVSESSASNAREVRAPSCVEVVNALAVVTAIALDTPVPSASSNAAAPTEESAEAAVVPPVQRVRASSLVSHQATKVEAGTVRIDNDMSLTVAGAALIGLVPSHATPRLDLGFARANFVTLPNGESTLVGPVVRVRASLLLDQNVRIHGQQVDIGGQEVGIGVCFSPLYDTRGWQLLACNELSVGFLGYRTTDATGARSAAQTQGFGAIGLGGEASYDLGAHFQLGLRVGGQLLSDRVHVPGADGAEIFQSSRVFGSAALSLGAHF